MADILLVEPDKVLARTYVRALQGAGFKVVWAANAQAAIRATDKHRPSLIILELQLAEHGGVEFIYELRSYPDWQRLPVLILSMVPQVESGMSDMARQKLGVVAYYYKPGTSLEQLVQATQGILARA
jgi:DNA-binding response OmpR family regulator